MAYTLKDAKGKEWAGPSINGLKEIKQLMIDNSNIKRPALEQLLQHGHTPMLASLSQECRSLARLTTDVNLQGTLNSLAATARNADEVVIMEH